MQETTDSKNEETDWMRRPRVLVESVENWRKSNGRSSSGTARRHSLERMSSWIEHRGDDDWYFGSEQSPEEAGGAGTVKIDGKPGDLGKPTARASTRRLFVRQGASRVEERPVCVELGVGSSHDTQDVGDDSTDLQLGCGPRSSISIAKGGEQGPKNEARKEICDVFDDRECSVVVPDSQRSDQGQQNDSAEAEGSQRRRERLGKQIEIYESDDEDSRPETLLCLGTHPRVVSATGSSGLGSSSGLPGPSGGVELDNRFGNEGTLSKGKRKRDVDRSESAAAVSFALENAEGQFDESNQNGTRLFPERPTRRLLLGGLGTSSLCDFRRTTELDRDLMFSLLDSPSTRRPQLRRNFPGVSSSVRPDSQPIVLDRQEQDMEAEGFAVEEKSEQALTLSLESPVSRTSLPEALRATYNSAEIIDLISPEPDHCPMNRFIDLVSPERSPRTDALDSNWRVRQEQSVRARVRRDRGRLTRPASDRFVASTARQQRLANGAGSSQVQPVSDGVGLPANEHSETESSGRRAETSLNSGVYFRRSGPSTSWDSDDIRVLEQVPVQNQMAGGSYRRRQRRYFPVTDMPSSGGDPTIRGGGIPTRRPRWRSPNNAHAELWANLAAAEDESYCLADNPFDSDDDGERSRRQLAEDERMARQLQAAYASEAVGGEVPDDETFARRLQAEEDSMARGFRHPRVGDFFSSSPVQRYMGDLQTLSRDSPPRFLRHSRPRSDTSSTYSSSSSRFNFVPGGRTGRYVQFHRGQEELDAEFPGGRVQFPSHLTMESRMEVLAVLENAIQEQVSVGFQLAQVDRDFNENDYEMLLALDTDLDRNRGASLEKISLLPVTTLQPTDVCEDTCSICLEMQVSGEVVRRLPCIHVFHKKCIDKWLQRQAVCPVCKAHI